MKLRYTFLGIFILLFQLCTFSQEYQLDWVNGFSETHSTIIFNPRQIGLGIEVASNEDIIVAGTYEDTVDFDPSANVSLGNGTGDYGNGIIARYTFSGSLVWNKTLTAEKNFPLTLTALQLDEQDNIYVSGFFGKCMDFDLSPNSATICSHKFSQFNPYVAKYDDNGNYVWAFAALDAMTVTATNTRIYYAMHMDEDHNAVYLISQFLDSVYVDQQIYHSNGGFDLVIIKLDLDGNYKWSKQIGGTGDEYVSDVETDQNGDLLYVGHFENTVDFDPSPTTNNLSCPVPGNFNLFLSKLDSSGQFVWAKSFESSDDQPKGSALFKPEAAYASMELDENDNIFLASRFNGTVDLDPDGGTETIQSEGDYDFFLARYTAVGSFFWKKRISVAPTSAYYEKGRIACMRLRDDKIYITGSCEDTMDFDVSTPNGDIIDVDGSSFIARYNTDGAFNWVHINERRNYRAPINDIDRGIVKSICFDSKNNIYATGEYGGTMDFDNDGDTLTNTLRGTTDMFIAKYRNLLIGIDEQDSTAVSFNLYPNPASEEVFISLTGSNKRMQLEVTDALGRQITKQRINKLVFKLDVSRYPKGLYFVRVSDGEVVGVRKLVVR